MFEHLLHGRRAARALVCVVALSAALFIPQSALAGTHISDGTHISSNTEWTATNSPYILDGSAYVDSGVTLTIDAGVTVQLAGGHFATFTINGTLDANGSSGNPVTITSGQSTPSAGDWYHLYVNGSASLDYTDVYYGGWGFSDATNGEVVVTEGGSATIDHSIIDDSETAGLLDGLGGTSNYASATVTHSTFSSSDDGIYVNNGYLSLGSNNQITSNTTDGVALNYSSSYSGTATDISNNTISSNGRYGIYYVPASAFVGSSSEPTGTENNIYENSNYQLYDTQHEPNLDWTGNYWGTSYTYTNPSVCLDYWPDSPYHIQSTSSSTSPTEGPVFWNEHDITVQIDDVEVTFHCGIDQVKAVSYATSYIDNSGL